MADPLARLQRLTEQELLWCLRFNRAVRKRGVERLFAVVSRLGDGIFWYCLMACLMLIDGLAALPALGRMITAGAMGLFLYRWLKTKTTRPRPCDHTLLIRATVAPLDTYSFPSGHTLHAVSFSLVAIFYYPRLAWLVIPFTGLVAVSRLVLGLHYPSDVLAGALLGAGLATLALQF
jgi:undecaprenyl-diphosphatase